MRSSARARSLGTSRVVTVGTSGFEAGFSRIPSRFFHILSKLSTVSKESRLHPFKFEQQGVRVGRVTS